MIVEHMVWKNTFGLFINYGGADFNKFPVWGAIVFSCSISQEFRDIKRFMILVTAHNLVGCNIEKL